jgi:putative NADH-flavin reductase
MKVVIFGASGKSGQEIVKQSLANGHQVTAFVRDPSSMDAESESLQIISGDVLDPDAVTQAVAGQDAVICALGTNSLGKTTLRSDGTGNMIRAMEDRQVKRLIVISAMGIGDSWSTLSTSNKLFFNTVLRNTKKDHELQEVMVKKSSLEWTIVRPSGLTDDPLTESYNLGENILANSSRISRADVAHCIVRELDDKLLIGKAVTITN